MNPRIGAVLVAAVGVVVGLLVLDSGARPASEPPEVVVRGIRADRHSFALDSLHTADETRAVRQAHVSLVEACRAELDEPEPEPTFTATVEIPGTAIGDDGPVEVATNWTEGSCVWEAHEALGVDDPIRLEGLRIAMETVLEQADERFRVDSRAVGAINTWIQCTGLDFDGLTALLSNSTLGANPPREECLTELDLAALRDVRAEHHLNAAAPNQLLIDEYVGLVDTQIAAASGSLGPRVAEASP